MKNMINRKFLLLEFSGVLYDSPGESYLIFHAFYVRILTAQFAPFMTSKLN